MTVTRPLRNLLIFSLSLVLVFLSLASYAQGPALVRTDPYKKWLDEDVRWIISDQERTDFKKLSTDQQRDQFVVAFWDRRNPLAGAPENAFKEKHYRRLAYSNQHLLPRFPDGKLIVAASTSCTAHLTGLYDSGAPTSHS